ncbi:cytochrome P450 [Wolfiporia cocos MD-104 SS10]|uniref:Cytochrome P450 n=1 Tax=Wolfiporia cocos (strain MD-104) TaxID=742152 RepID=A0A2H3K2G5_WOLCO|nr:cytochrome P450 [Wolfiporia cocos MD-104 SS10]
MPVTYQWETFSKWAQKWGTLLSSVCDIVSVTVLGQPFVILSSATYMNLLLEKNSAISSDRPPSVVANTLVGWDRTGLTVDYNHPRLRELRRLIIQRFGTRTAVASYSHILEQQTAQFISRIWWRPDKVTDEVRRHFGALILNLAYGYQVELDEDPMLKTAEETMRAISHILTPGAMLVDLFPSLQYVPDWLPGAGWKAIAKDAKKLADEMFSKPFEFAKKQIASIADGSALPSFTSSGMDRINSTVDEEMVKNTAGSLYAGGADTSVSAICSFFLAMMCYPEIQDRARQEIDRVVGCDRLPQLSDREHLPYINAICLEVLRWNPVTPIGIPHRLSKDIVLEDYFLPKGSIIVANIWKHLHDPHIHSEPYQFKPERFLPSDTGLQPEPNPRNLVFGFGRRTCPGAHLAEASIFLMCAMSLAVFDIAKPVGNGVVLEPKIEYTGGTVSHPQSYKCLIRTRSRKVETLLKALDGDSGSYERTMNITLLSIDTGDKDGSNAIADILRALSPRLPVGRDN